MLPGRHHAGELIAWPELEGSEWQGRVPAWMSWQEETATAASSVGADEFDELGVARYEVHLHLLASLAVEGGDHEVG